MHLFYLQSEISGKIEQESIHYILTLFSAVLYRCTRCPFQPDDDVYITCHIYIYLHLLYIIAPFSTQKSYYKEHPESKIYHVWMSA
jgi:hypothetical protein